MMHDIPMFSQRQGRANSVDLLEDQSDQGLHCLTLGLLHILWEAILFSMVILLNFRVISATSQVSENLGL